MPAGISHSSGGAPVFQLELNPFAEDVDAELQFSSDLGVWAPVEPAPERNGEDTFELPAGFSEEGKMFFRWSLKAGR